MASNQFSMVCADGKTHTFQRGKQGRKPTGLTRWTGRLFDDDLKAIREYCAETGAQENDVIRIAIRSWRNNVPTELLNP